MPDAISLYRELLAAADDHSITIVTVGPLGNIRDLLASGPDRWSALNGHDLFHEKVARMVIMGGRFPDDTTDAGPEWNFDGNMPGVTQTVLAQVERPIVFSGYEVGHAIRVGAVLNEHPADSPLFVGYRYFSEHAPWMKQDYAGVILDNAAFDQTAVVFAAEGKLGEFWRLSERGTATADERGFTTWQSDPEGLHHYLVLEPPVGSIADYIAAGMLAAPRSGTGR